MITLSGHSRWLAGALLLVPWSVFAAEPNDNFVNATAVSGEPLSLEGNVAAATAELGEPRHGGEPAAHSIWWRWTAPRAGTVIIQATGNGFTPVVGAYSGNNVAALVRVDQGWVSTPNRNAFAATAGIEYYIAVDGTSPTGDLTLALSMQDSPANDAFANRATLQGTSILVPGSNDHATSEPSEPIHWTSTDSHSVWWTWTAPVDGHLLGAIDTDGLDVVLAMYTGSALNALTLIDRIGDSGTRVALGFDVVAGTTYQIAVSSHGTTTGTFRLSLELHDPPVNDRFADAIPLDGESFTFSTSNVGAGREAGEPSLPLAGLLSSVWWKWTAPAAGRVVIDTGGSDFDTLLAAYTGSGLNFLSIVDFNNDRDFNDLTSLLQFNAEAGITYYIQVDGYKGATGTIQFAFDLVSMPANDDFSNRAVLTGTSADITATNRGASRESGEPNHSDRQSAVASVWWTWTAPSDGEVLIRMAGSEIESVLAVYTGSTLGTLSRIIYDHPSTRVPRVSFVAVAGMSYQIAVDGADGALGALHMTLEYIEPSPNDGFASRIVLDGWTFATTGTNVGATGEAAEPSHYQNDPQHSVWWSWTAPVTGPVIVDTIGSDFDTVLSVYSGATLATLLREGTANDISNEDTDSRLTFTAVAGTTYQIAVDGGYLEFGTAHLNLAVEMPHGEVAPLSGPLVVGSDVTLHATVSGRMPRELQWYRDGVAIPGANTDTLLVPAIQSFNASGYAIEVTNDLGTFATTAVAIAVTPAAPSGAKLLNLSTRARSEGTSGALIPGFVIGGSGTKQVLVRAVGPGLGAYGLDETLPDPVLVVNQKINGVYTEIARNDNWEDTAVLQQVSSAVGAFEIAPGSLDAALILDLEAGEYTAVAQDGTGLPGRAIVELYDASPEDVSARLVNISNRGFVGVGDDVMIPGFVVSSEGAKTFLIRAVGPGLDQFGVENTLADPAMTLYRAEAAPAPSTRLLENDDWGTGANAAETEAVGAQVLAFPLASGSTDAAFVVTLPPGLYTVQAGGKDGATGVVLVEIYAVP